MINVSLVSQCLSINNTYNWNQLLSFIYIIQRGSATLTTNLRVKQRRPWLCLLKRFLGLTTFSDSSSSTPNRSNTCSIMRICFPAKTGVQRSACYAVIILVQSAGGPNGSKVVLPAAESQSVKYQIRHIGTSRSAWCRGHNRSLLNVC